MSSYNWKGKLLGKTIVIWGASIGGNQAYQCLVKNGFQIEAYCDNDVKKQMNLYNGKRVLSPLTLKEIFKHEKNYVIIIASYAFEKIYEQINQIGFDCEVYLYLLYDPCHLKTGELSYTERERKEIRSIYDTETYTVKLLEMILDKGFLNENAFDNICEYIGFGGIEAYYYDDIATKISSVGGGITLLDVGSYTGDSILQIKDVFAGKLSKIYAFEPSEENRSRILDKHIDSLVLYKVGLGSENGYSYFSESGPFFRVSEDREGVLTEIVKLDSLDIAVEGDCILKIDIEGSEMGCLSGAQNFISKYKPYIAVCVYHRERDILEIPKYIKRIAPEYHFVLRGGMHTVCYAFPDSEVHHGRNR